MAQSPTGADTSQFNCYNILVVPQNASGQAIRSAYYTLIKQWHPDHNKSPDATNVRALFLTTPQFLYTLMRQS